MQSFQLLNSYFKKKNLTRLLFQFQKEEEGVKNNIDDLKNKIQGLETELKSLHIQFEREKEEMEEKFKLKEGELVSQIESLENTNKTIKVNEKFIHFSQLFNIESSLTGEKKKHISMV